MMLLWTISHKVERLFQTLTQTPIVERWFFETLFNLSS